MQVKQLDKLLERLVSMMDDERNKVNLHLSLSLIVHKYISLSPPDQGLDTMWQAKECLSGSHQGQTGR